MRLYYLFIAIFFFGTLNNLSAQKKGDITLNINQFRGLPSETSINNVIVDDNGVIWAASKNGLYLINPSLGTAELQSEIGNVKDVVFTPNSQWIAYDNYVVDLKSGEKIELKNIEQINDLAYVNKVIWVATDKGIFQIIPSTKNIKHYTTNNSKLKSNKINFIHQDKHKIIWLGTDKGYIRIEQDKWEVEDDKYKMLLTYENNEGQWIISDDDLFLMNEFNRYFPVGIEDGLIQGTVKDFTIDSKGKIYIVSDILVRYDPYENKINDFVENVKEFTSACTSIERDRNDNIWIGTENNGLFIIRFSDNKSDALFANLVLTEEISCYGDQNGSLEVVVTGGLPPYSYKWSDVDSNEGKRSSLAPGEYSVVITDQSGQSFKSSKTIPEPKKLMITSVEINDIKSVGKEEGSILVDVQGGSGNLSYQWSTNASKKYINNLSSGEYVLTITDARGCSLVQTYEVKKPKYIPELTKGKIEVGTTLRIEQLFFEADSTYLREENFPILDEIYEFLESNPGIKIEIGGHTNTIPPHEYCDRLSTSRAKRVASYLYNRGIGTNRITYVGYGKRKPLTEERSAAARRKNQRVELKVIEI
jgi:outer membrane protein OmpA-like peptidoglycan-associated protein